MASKSYLGSKKIFYEKINEFVENDNLTISLKVSETSKIIFVGFCIEINSYTIINSDEKNIRSFEVM